MKIEMRFWMDGKENVQYPMADPGFQKDLKQFASEIAEHIGKDYSGYVENVNGEVALESEGEFIFKKRE